mmetsp:Transcript_27507/g.89597  ORF Transcript_27507/g.89597 Transcript_27507/m.89597 type:complete len:201 (-) Transcript_27507:485-1087(-)
MPPAVVRLQLDRDLVREGKLLQLSHLGHTGIAPELLGDARGHAGGGGSGVATAERVCPHGMRCIARDAVENQVLEQPLVTHVLVVLGDGVLERAGGDAGEVPSYETALVAPSALLGEELLGGRSKVKTPVQLSSPLVVPSLSQRRGGRAEGRGEAEVGRSSVGGGDHASLPEGGVGGCKQLHLPRRDFWGDLCPSLHVLA